ncbi:MAG TPA: hypothetical protein VM533_19950 [Fimbriiglobus sp.]|jgi:hypothetical protein|nr:hypothetical protein [Fimbriiglobus sp.]
MHHKYDPLSQIPSPQVVREQLAETQALAARLAILLDLAERLHAVATTSSATPADPGQGVARD